MLSQIVDEATSLEEVLTDALILTKCEATLERVETAMAQNQSISAQDALIAICYSAFNRTGVGIGKRPKPYSAISCKIMLRTFPHLLKMENGERHLLPLDIVVCARAFRVAMRDFPAWGRCSDWPSFAIQNWNKAVELCSPTLWAENARYGMDGETGEVIAYHSKKAERLAAAKAAKERTLAEELAQKAKTAERLAAAKAARIERALTKKRAKEELKLAKKAKTAERLAAAKAARIERALTEKPAKEERRVAKKVKKAERLAARPETRAVRAEARMAFESLMHDWNANWSHIYGEKVGALPVFCEDYFRTVRKQKFSQFVDHDKRRWAIPLLLFLLVRSWLNNFGVSATWIRSKSCRQSPLGGEIFYPAGVRRDANSGVFKMRLHQAAITLMIIDGLATVTSTDQDGQILAVDFSSIHHQSPRQLIRRIIDSEILRKKNAAENSNFAG